MNKKFKTLNNNKILNYYQLNKFYYKTLNHLPFIQKITASFNQKTNDLKQITATHLAIKILFFQKSVTTKVNKSNIFYGTKKGHPTGCKITANNKIKVIEILNLIFNILVLNHNNLKIKLNKNNGNTLNFNVFEIYKFQKLENYYLLLNKLKKLNISFLIFSNNKNYNEINYLIKIQFFI